MKECLKGAVTIRSILIFLQVMQCPYFVTNTFTLWKFSIFVKIKKIKKAGFIPWARGNHSLAMEMIRNFSSQYPEEITLFHLNKGDYSQLRLVVTGLNI